MATDRVMLTEIIEGPVGALERVYAFDQIRDLCRTTPRAVHRARTRLTAQPRPAGDRPAVAEGTLLLDGGLIVCAGVAAATMREAVDQLVARLRHRLRWVSEAPSAQPMGSLPVSAA